MTSCSSQLPRNVNGGGCNALLDGISREVSAMVAITTANLWVKTELLMHSFAGVSDNFEILVGLPGCQSCHLYDSVTDDDSSSCGRAQQATGSKVHLLRSSVQNQ